jgi:hypothetical protein
MATSDDIALAIEGMNIGHYGTVWEKTFFILPLAHSERLAMHERMVALCEAMIAEVPEKLRGICMFSASQARASPSDCSFSPVAARIATGRSP